MKRNIEYGEWVGTGYIVLATEIGSAGYMISGGLAEGSTSSTDLFERLVVYLEEAVIGVATTGGLVALKKLAKHLKLLKGACFTGDIKVLTEAQKLIQIKTERAEIKVTSSHPMLKVENTWVFAGVLKVGDKLVGYDGDEVEVTEVEEEVLESPEKVYNLTIEDFHTYVAIRRKCCSS